MVIFSYKLVVYANQQTHDSDKNGIIRYKILKKSGQIEK